MQEIAIYVKEAASAQILSAARHGAELMGAVLMKL